MHVLVSCACFKISLMKRKTLLIIAEVCLWKWNCIYSIHVYFHDQISIEKTMYTHNTFYLSINIKIRSIWLHYTKNANDSICMDKCVIKLQWLSSWFKWKLFWYNFFNCQDHLSQRLKVIYSDHYVCLSSVLIESFKWHFLLNNMTNFKQNFTHIIFCGSL